MPRFQSSNVLGPKITILKSGLFLPFAFEPFLRQESSLRILVVNWLNSSLNQGPRGMCEDVRETGGPHSCYSAARGATGSDGLRLQSAGPRGSRDL